MAGNEPRRTRKRRTASPVGDNLVLLAWHAGVRRLRFRLGSWGFSLRLALITGNYDSVVDGVALCTQRQVSHFARAGVPVRVYAPASATPAPGDVVRVASVPFAPPYRLALGIGPQLHANLAAFRPTIVHVGSPDFLGASAQAWARRRGIPVVGTFYTHFGSYLHYYRAGFLEPLAWRWLKRFYERCAEVYVPGESMIDELRRHGLRANFVVSPFGVDPAQFAPSHRSETWRAAHAVAPHEIAVLFVGRLVWEKNLEVFARAVNRVPGLRPVIVGEGPAGAAFRALLPHAAFTGKLRGDALSAAFASCDIFFFPSASETFGCVTVEALASGLPCVVADATGSRDIVRDGVEGFVRPPTDEVAFAEVLRQLAADPVLRERLRKQGLERAASFHWEPVLARLLSHFRRVALTFRNLRT